MIGTHNSGTGEHSAKWYHKLLVPFAKCQRYDIKGQLKAGSRIFDLRVREAADSTDDYILCHGLWESSTKLDDVLDSINSYGIANGIKYKVLITYEGSLKNEAIKLFRLIIVDKLNKYNNIQVAQIAIKKPKWTAVYNDNITNIKQGFKCLDFSSWHTLIPIPWLWSKFYTKTDDTTNIYTLIDFL